MINKKKILLWFVMIFDIKKMHQFIQKSKRSSHCNDSNCILFIAKNHQHTTYRYNWITANHKRSKCNIAYESQFILPVFSCVFLVGWKIALKTIFTPTDTNSRQSKKKTDDAWICNGDNCLFKPNGFMLVISSYKFGGLWIKCYFT